MNIIKDFIPIGNKNRPQKANPCIYITIHNTGNQSKGANALSHADYLKSTNDYASWHFTVDDTNIVQHLPCEETAYHAGDGLGDGNMKSIGIEICVHGDGDLIKAHDNAAMLVKRLMTMYDIDLSCVVQHNHWSGKNCPQWLREGNPYTWNDFISKLITTDNAIQIVKSKANLSDSTINYITHSYRWGEDLIKKLAIAMK